MSVNVKECTMVCPATETPQKTIWLSNIDLTRLTLYSHMPSICIYTPNSENKKANNYFDPQILKEALSKALVHFYPVAGRLRKNEQNGRIEVNCNAEGVLFVDAEAIQDFEVDDLIKNAELRRLFVPSCDYSAGLSSFPLLMIQVTRFKCGGVCVAFALHHFVADGLGYAFFYTSWARLAKGLTLLVHPSYDRRPALARRNPPQVKFQHLEFEAPLQPIPPLGYPGEMATTKECLFKFSKQQISALVIQAKSHSEEAKNTELSIYEVLAAHVWRSTCKARGLTGDQYVKLYIPIDGRWKLKDPALPKGYFGNIIFFATCKAKAYDVTCKPLRYVASKVQEELKKFESSEYLRSSVDYLESQSDLTPFVRGAHSATCPNLSLNSWTKMQLPEGDLGWGMPKFVGLGRKCNEGQAFFLPSPESGSIYLSIALFSVHMPLFEKYLYDFQSLSTNGGNVMDSNGSSVSPLFVSKI